MCKAFSGVIVRSRKVYWKAGMDSHSDIYEHFKLSDTEQGKTCPFEISPKNGNYISTDKWVFKFDDGIPEWWKQSHETACWSAFRKWKKEFYSKINLKEAKKPVNPFKLKPPKIAKKHIKLLKEWASISDSVYLSFMDSVVDSVGTSVGTSVYLSVRDSVLDSVYAYIGSLFKLTRKQWKHTSKIKTKGYPFMPAVKLWKMGVVPGFDGVVWRLHGGKKAKVLYEITEKELRKVK